LHPRKGAFHTQNYHRGRLPLDLKLTPTLNSNFSCANNSSLATGNKHKPHGDYGVSCLRMSLILNPDSGPQPDSLISYIGFRGAGRTMGGPWADRGARDPRADQMSGEWDSYGRCRSGSVARVTTVSRRRRRRRRQSYLSAAICRSQAPARPPAVNNKPVDDECGTFAPPGICPTHLSPTLTLNPNYKSLCTCSWL